MQCMLQCMLYMFTAVYAAVYAIQYVSSLDELSGLYLDRVYTRRYGDRQLHDISML